MTYYSVLEVTPTTDEWVSDYVGAANALVAKHGGTYLARTAGSDSHHFLIEGKDDLA